MTLKFMHEKGIVMRRSLFNTPPALITVAVLALAATAMPLAAAEPGDDMRVSRSKFYASDGRRQAVPDKVELSEVPNGSESPAAQKTGRRSESASSGTRRTETPNTDFWFYTADVILFSDEDNDGYYYGIDLLFDADTVYEQADVFAVLYLSRDGGPWMEYAETDVFPIFGATSDDDYVIVTELLDGYPRGSYDLLIELYDTWDGAFVAEIGPADTSALSFLPLEDAERDKPRVVVVEQGGGGAVDLLQVTLLALSLVLVRRRRRPTHAVADRQGRAG